jgi:hypothetical protein
MDANFDLEGFFGNGEDLGSENIPEMDIEDTSVVEEPEVVEPEEELVEVKPKKPQPIQKTQKPQKPAPKEKTESIEKRLEEDVKKSLEVSGTPDYETTVTLPSKGILYNGLIPSEISLRGMTTRDEKIMYASQGGNVFQRILKNCIVQPKNLDTSKLIAADELFLVLQLRMITYGPEYRVDTICPECGQVNTFNVNLGELDVNYLDDNFTEPIIVKLPRSGDTLGLRILRNEDSEFIDRYSKKFAKQFNQNVREVEYICRLAKYISTINNKPVDFGQAKEYVENMMSRDSAEIRSALSKILVGVDTTITKSCSSCGEEFTFVMPLTSEFFRPSFE